MPQKPIIVLGDSCEDTYVFARERRTQHLSEPETPIKEYSFTPVRVPTLARGLGQYLKNVLKVDVIFENKRPKGHYAKSMFLVSQQKQNSNTVWCIDKDFQLPPGQPDWVAVAQFDGKTSIYNALAKNDDYPVFCMDYDHNWRKNFFSDLADLINNRRYIIRSHDPRRKEWIEFRKRLHPKGPGIKPGIWLCHSVDIADGALRAPGIWEDHRLDICSYFQRDITLWNPTSNNWLHHIIIKIDQDGVLILGPSTREKGVLFISAGDQPGSFIRKHPHHVVGNGLVFFAAFASAVMRDHLDEKEMHEDLVKCAKDGLSKCRMITAEGYKDPKPTPDPYKIRGIYDLIPNVEGVTITDFLIDYDDISRQTKRARATNIVYGKYSKFLKSIVFTLGNFATADIEFARSILTLESRLRAHLQPNNKGILSFAVFGEPGSGKSFIAKKLIQSIDPANSVFELITFNMSQFGGYRNRLVQAFLEIEAIAKRKIPFVLWDEFDTAIEGEKCAWLPEFLMPMQDAKFFDDRRVGELGKCIFSFMGGIHPNDGEFMDWAESESGKLLKGPDFHSRLQSSLPLSTVTAKSGFDSNLDSDDLAKVTRAILIRSFLEKHKTLKVISQDVLAFLLHVPLQHGARSLEKIIDASALDKTETYSIWHLPSVDVLRLHVKYLNTKSFNVVADFLKYNLQGHQLTPEQLWPLLWRSYQPSISKKLSMDLAIPFDVTTMGQTEATLGQRIIGLAKKLAFETHKAWQEKCNDPKATFPFDHIKQYDNRLNIDYTDLHDPEKEQYLAAAMETIRKEMGWKSDNKL